VRAAAILDRWQRHTCSVCGDGYRVGPGIDPGSQCPSCDQPVVVKPSRAKLLRSLGVPMRLATTTFRAPKTWPEGIEDWIGIPWSVTLRGPVGTGKSMMAAELLHRIGRGLWIRASKMVSLVYNAESRSERTAVQRRYEWAPCLVIDDFGHGHRGAATETVAEVIAERWDAARPTVVTTNCRAADLVGEDAAAYERPRDGLMVALVGESRRGEK